ncbi:MAG: hypothetical protein WCV50_03590 [Patescibacteria group bacterium]|jgi:Tfp pilus assembly protein PilV
MKIIFNKKGQSLLEVIIAVSVLLISLTATIVLVVTSINAGRDSRNKLIGSSLAREGIEIVRNIRDSNWSDPSHPAWDSGLVSGNDNMAQPVIDGTSNITLDFSITAPTNLKYSDALDQFLQGSSASGSRTEFFRILYLNPICRLDTDGDEKIPVKTSTDDCTAFGLGYAKVGVRIISEVHWPDASSSKKIIIEDRLYNWLAL